MNSFFNAKQSIVINASSADVWDALTNPVKIKQYLFGTEVISDWQIGSAIKYRGVWKGQSYEDKGIILNLVPEKLFESTYWSNLSGLPDIPENYKKVRYEILTVNGGTRVTVIQDNNASDEEKKHLEQNWSAVLEGLKKVVEGNQ